MNTNIVNRSKPIKQRFINNIIFIFFIILFIACIIATPDFLTDFNITNLLRQYAAPTLMAIGMLFVILTGGIDLSIGAVVAVTNVVCAMLIVNRGMPMGTSVVIALIVGALCGVISGILIAFRRVAPFIATLAIMSIANSASFMLSEGSNIAIRNP